MSNNAPHIDKMHAAGDDYVTATRLADDLHLAAATRAVDRVRQASETDSAKEGAPSEQ